MTARTKTILLVLYLLCRYDREDKDAKESGIEVGPWSITLQTIVISIYSIVTVVPLAVLLSGLFTSSKPRRTASDDQVFG